MTNQKIETPYNQRYYRESNTPKVKNLLNAFIQDISFKKNRYEYVEFFLRNIPGESGLSLRYYILSNYYKKVGADVIIWPGVRVKHPYNLTIGNQSQLGYNTMYQAVAGIKIGDNVLIGPGSKIWTMNHKLSDLEKNITEQGYDCAPVLIENNCWITSNVFIKPGAHLEKGCLVTPNTVVQGIRYKENSIISGNPGKIIGNKNMLRNLRSNK
jgi:acetyltransferase-like isoleucine patch superfamily enzyme